MRQVFISYHHGNDQKYKDRLVERAKKNKIFADMSVERGDVPENIDDGSIRVRIRDEHLRESTVTIVLVGTETYKRKFVDWEIHSSMYDGDANTRSGIVAVMLPETGVQRTHAPHGADEKKLYPGSTWVSGPSSRAEWEERYPGMPDLLIDNLLKDDVMISVVPWDDIDDNVLRGLVEIASRDRSECKYDLSRKMMRDNM